MLCIFLRDFLFFLYYVYSSLHKFTFPIPVYKYSITYLILYFLCCRSPWLHHKVHLPTSRHCKRGQHRKSHNWICTQQISKWSFSAMESQFSPFLSDSKHINLIIIRIRKILHRIQKVVPSMFIFTFNGKHHLCIRGR